MSSEPKHSCSTSPRQPRAGQSSTCGPFSSISHSSVPFLAPKKEPFLPGWLSLMTLTAFKSLPLSPFPMSTSVCSSSKLSFFFHLHTQEEVPQAREAERTWFSPAGRKKHGCIKIYTDQPRQNFHKLIPANISVLRSFPSVPILMSVLQGSVRLGTVTHSVHYAASWVAANPEGHASPNIAAPFNCLAYLPSLLHGS